jgi:flagellar basal-body rod protein FlgG
MLRGIYTATSGMLTAQRDINVRGNNLANISTAGFKSDRLVATTFAEALAIRQQTRTTGRHIDLAGMEQPNLNALQQRRGEDAWDEEMQAALSRITVSRGRTALEVMTDFSQGALQMTERSLDLAIAGEGFFMIRSNRGDFDEYDNPYGVHEGMYYTRNGQFQLSGEENYEGPGFLINGMGDFVLDDFGDIIWIGTDHFAVSEAGDIFRFNPETGFFDDYIARLGIFNPDNPNLLIKNGDNIFSILNENFAPENLVEEYGFTGAIRQNYIERSNTDVAAEMAGLMTSSRSFQSMSQILQAIDAALGRSINEVGRV